MRIIENGNKQKKATQKLFPVVLQIMSSLTSSDKAIYWQPLDSISQVRLPFDKKILGPFICVSVNLIFLSEDHAKLAFIKCKKNLPDS